MITIELRDFPKLSGESEEARDAPRSLCFSLSVYPFKMTLARHLFAARKHRVPGWDIHCPRTTSTPAWRHTRQACMPLKTHDGDDLPGCVLERSEKRATNTIYALRYEDHHRGPLRCTGSTTRPGSPRGNRLMVRVWGARAQPHIHPGEHPRCQRCFWHPFTHCEHTRSQQEASRPGADQEREGNQEARGVNTPGRLMQSGEHFASAASALTWDNHDTLAETRGQESKENPWQPPKCISVRQTPRPEPKTAPSPGKSRMGTPWRQSHAVWATKPVWAAPSLWSLG